MPVTSPVLDSDHVNLPVVLRDGDISPELHAAAMAEGLAACDTETTGLDCRRDQLRLVQVHVPGSGTELVRITDAEAKYLTDLIASPAVTKVFHHATFDLSFLQKLLGIRAVSVVCTKVAAKLLWPDDRAAQRLTGLTERYLNVVLDKSQQTSDWSAPHLSAAQVTYAATDVLHLPFLYERVSAELQAQELLELATACWAHLPVRAELEHRGFGDVFAY